MLIFIITDINNFFFNDIFYFHFSNSLLARIPLSFLTACSLIVISFIKELKPPQTFLADVAMVTRLALTVIAADTESSI